MKKRTLLLSVFALIFLSSFILAVEVCDEGDTGCKINNGYSCLAEKIDIRGCDSLSSGEKVFSALASGDCKTSLKSDTKFITDLKYTAQTVLALGGDLEGEEWLLGKKFNPSEIDWFLQIESTEATTCTITYNGKDNTVSIGKDKKFLGNGGGGDCLPLDTTTSGGYWLKVSDLCYGKVFEVSCDQSFLTSLLYQKQNSNTIYVVEDTSSASENGITTEQVNSSCFKQGNACNYEGSLWAATVLDSFNYDISSYMPYLITLADEDINERFLPEAFLYLLTNDFYPELLSKQKNSKWWAQSSDKFYDTALALYALQYDEPPEKENARKWLLESQDSDGCWNNGNLRNTAFILYSLEPRASGGVGGGGAATCQSAGYFCLSSISCSEAGGEKLDSYSCSGVFECCTEPKLLESCSDQGGDVCNSVQICSGGTELDASGLGTGQVCCFGGSCKSPETSVSECEDFGYECRVTGCQEGEEQTSSICEYKSDYCCKPKTGGGGIGAIWIVMLLLLIVLVVVGIIYKDQLRKILFRFKNKFMPSKGGPGRPLGPGSRRPPFSPRAPPGRRPLPRRVIPAPIQAPNPRMMANVRPRKDVDDVLKKLKEMGK